MKTSPSRYGFSYRIACASGGYSIIKDVRVPPPSPLPSWPFRAAIALPLLGRVQSGGFWLVFLVNFSLLDLASFYPCRELILPETKRVALRETFGRQVTRVHFPAEIPPTRLA